MICASIAGDLETIKTLVARDPNLINCEYEYFTPIRFAVRENQREVIDFLLEKGVSPAYELGDSLVTIACDRGYDKLAAYLESILKDRYHIIPEGKIIAGAIRAFNIGQVQALINKQPSLVHAADERGNQPIHWAVLTRQLDLIDYLLESGADVNAMRPDGAKPLDLTNGDYHYRSWYRDLPPNGLSKHEVLIGYLMARGAYCDISVAAKIGYYDRVKKLLEQDPSLVNRHPSYVDYYSGLPLRCAAGAGHVQVVKLLLQRGANPNEPEPGIAPQGGALHAAIGGKHYEIVKLLLQHGANANAEVESSGNCLFMAKWVVHLKRLSI
jgi:ankyrin repeat protein